MIPHHIAVGLQNAMPLVLVHGFPFSLEQWRPQIDALADEFRVIALDLRGHGKSPVVDGPVFVEDLVDDVIELLDHHGLAAACLGGLSMGGYVVLRGVDRHPDRVRGLLLADTRAAPDDDATRVKRAAAARAIRERGMKAFADSMIPALFSEAAIQANTPAVRSIRSQMEATDPRGAALALGALAARLDQRERVAAIRVPTLVLVGSDDRVTPPADAEFLAKAIPGAELVVLPNAGHVSNLDAPDATTAAMRDFLRRVERTTSPAKR